MLRQEGTELRKRGVSGEDELRRPSSKCRHDLRDAGADQRVIASGLVAQQVVHEEVPRGTIQPRVEVERTLPAPDVEMRLVPDRPTPRDVAAQTPEHDPLPTALVADRQLPRRDVQVIPALEDRSPADRDDQDHRRGGGGEWTSARDQLRSGIWLCSRIDNREADRAGNGD